MKRALLLCTLVTSVMAQAQMILVEPGLDDPAQLHFNPEFIARNGVKSMKGRAWKKPDGRPMVPLDRFFLYRFGPDGSLGYSNNSFGKPGSGIDTASVMYTYNNKGDLLQELHNDINGYFSLRKEFDEMGRTVHVTNVRLENLSGDRYRFVEGTNTVISDERYTYAGLNDTTWTKTFLNDRGRPYREETWTKNRSGYLLTVGGLNLITQKRDRTAFSYDGHGRLAERAEQPDLAKQNWTNWKWTYDAAGNPLTCDMLHNGGLVKHGEFLYAEGTLLLKAIITKNNETGMIDIVRYETER